MQTQTCGVLAAPKRVFLQQKFTLLINIYFLTWKLCIHDLELFTVNITLPVLP